MLIRPRSRLLRYGFALATVAVAFVVTHVISPLWQRESFIPFFGAVALSAWFGGRGPGLLASILAACLFDFVIFPPPWVVSLEPQAMLPALFFLAVAVSISSLTDGLSRAEKTAREKQQMLESTLKQILEYQQRLRSLASELSLAEERLRREIATGLHDRIGQSLGLARIKLSTLREKLEQPEAQAQADDLTTLLKQVITEVRTLTFELSPPILYEFGLEAGLTWLTENIRKQYGLPCAFERSGERPTLLQAQFVPIFQATRELLLNVVKHAHAKGATVRLENDADTVRVTVEDDGAGFDASAAALAPNSDNRFGLFNIRERINYLGGTFDLRSVPGKGTRVAFSLPVNNVGNKGL
jgi:signal transduction histidine kinase